MDDQRFMNNRRFLSNNTAVTGRRREEETVATFEDECDQFNNDENSGNVPNDCDMHLSSPPQSQ